MQKKRTEQIEEEAAVWILRMDSQGEHIVYEDQAFQKWLKLSGEHAHVFHALKKTWKELNEVGPVLSKTIRTGNDNNISMRFGMRSIYKLAMIAAMICFVFTASYSTGHFDALIADETTATGEIKQITLEDGSHIYLNSNSALNVEMTGLERRVILIKGEASFHVAKDQSRPFVVYSGGGQAKALGTIYTVRRKNNDEAVVSVIESQVEVAMGQERKILRAGERVVIGRGQHLGQVEKIDIVRTTAWERGKIIFENTPLSEVIDEINTHFSGYIRLSDPDIQKLQVNGVFELSDPLAVVSLLEASLDLKSTRLTDHLIFLHR